MEGDIRENNAQSVIITEGKECMEKKTLLMIRGLEKVSGGDMGIDLFIDDLKSLPPVGEITKQQLPFLYLFCHKYAKSS